MAEVNGNIALLAHLMRRAGFGATRSELESLSAKSYQEIVEDLLIPANPQAMPDDVIWRYHHEQSGMMGQANPGAYWLYKMISTNAPLQEKMALFWHGIFATGYPKIAQGRVLADQIQMFRRNGLGNFKDLLVKLSKDPAMIVWLDNHENHKGAINENFGRELLELFSLGVGNYTEDDIKDCARAFTGWTLGNTEYMALRAERDSIWPYGRISPFFEYKPEDHDDGEKAFLGRTGQLNGEDVIDIICKQPATAHFISRHMYHFFVADEPPVAQWPYTPPRDPEAIETLSRAYFDSNYDILSMLRVLLNSDFFKSEVSWYAKVKSPAELVAGVLRLSGEFDRPRREILDRALQMTYMGQQLTNPPSVEGWHQGTEWIDTGTLVERLNFATQQFSDVNKKGVGAMIKRISSQSEGVISPDHLVESCLDAMGFVQVSDETQAVLEQFASQLGEIRGDTLEENESDRQNVAQILQMVAATHEFQRS